MIVLFSSIKIFGNRLFVNYSDVMRESSTQLCGLDLKILGWSCFDFFVDFLERDKYEFLSLTLMFQILVHQHQFKF